MIRYKNDHLTVFQSALYQTNSSVVETKDAVLVIDPSWLPGEVQEIKNYVSAVLGNRPVYLLFTHSDWDHILGYGAFKNAITIGSKEFAENANKEQILDQIREFDDRNYIRRDYEVDYPRIDIPIESDGERLKLGQTEIVFYKSPGHTRDSMFVVIDALGLFFAGDYLSDLEFPLIENSGDYQQTLVKVNFVISGKKVKLLIPGHGSLTDDVDEIRLRQIRSLEYIRNLREFIRQSKSQEEIDALIEGYPFPTGLREFHAQNQRVIRRELGL